VSCGLGLGFTFPWSWQSGAGDATKVDNLAPVLPSLPGAAPARPWTLLAAAALVALEGLVLLGLGAYVGARGLLGGAASVRDAELVAVMAVLTGVGLLYVARGLARERRWARTPAMLTQVFALAVAWEPLRQAPAWRIPTLAVAVIALVLLFVRPSGEPRSD